MQPSPSPTKVPTLSKAQRTVRTAQILWGAILMSKFLFIGVGWLNTASQNRKASAEPMPPQFDLILAAIAVIVGVVSFVVPSILSKSIRAKSAGTPPAERGDLAAAIVPFVIGLALSDAVSILGLARATLSGEFTGSIPFFIAGIVLVLIRFPNQARLEALAGVNAAGPSVRIG